MERSHDELRQVGIRAGLILQPVPVYDIKERIKRFRLADDQRQKIEKAYSDLINHQATSQDLARFKEDYTKYHDRFAFPKGTLWICLEKQYPEGWRQTEAVASLEHFAGLVNRLEPKAR